MSQIEFTASLSRLSPTEDDSALVIVPKSESDKFPSRGIVMAEGLVNDIKVRIPLEPDGEASHWFKLNADFLSLAGVRVGDTVNVRLSPSSLWPDPELPADLQKLLHDDPDAHAKWQTVTPMARWDWIRWLDAVKLDETRRVRPEKLCSMLKHGKRRPCCFNRALQTPPRAAQIV